jgi:hypothetical protein
MMELVLVKSLNFLLFFLALTGCSSMLKLAGQDHALVFKKWQSLSNYAGDTFTHEPIFIVARLVVEQNENGKSFVLKDFQLTKEETSFQINLRTPNFENKFICDNKCVYLTEYFNLDAQNTTILTRYFDRYEFGLFKFYGDVFSLKKPILAMKNMSNGNFNDYVNWLVKKGEKFNNLDEFTDYMNQSFSVNAYIQFLQNPSALYSQMVTINIEQETSMFVDTQDVLAEETLMFELDNDEPPLEMVSWNIGPSIASVLTGQDSLMFDFKDSLMFDFKGSIQAEVGDLVCDLQNNSFGQVVETRGSQLSVAMIGKLRLIIDGIVSSSNEVDSFSSLYPKNYTKMEGIQSFVPDEVVVCELNYIS